MSPTRRRVLQGIGATTAAVLAGCTADDGGGNESDASANGTTTDAGDPADTDATEEYADPSSIEELGRQTIDLLQAGEYETIYERFGDTYQSQITVAAVERTHVGLNAAGGAIQSIGEPETAVRSGLDSADFPVELERTAPTIQINATEDLDLVGVLIVGEYEQASYAEPDSFEATEHTLEPEGCQLGATLTTPTDVEEAPGVVIVHGSGPSDRDATTGANAPYRDLAEGLASRGVAVLRYDKRSFACNVPAAEHTIDRVTVDDALHAIDWLRDRDDVATDDVTVVGHSQGAMMAPEIAARDGELAGVVGLAAPARPLTAVFLDQIRHLATVTEHESPTYGQQRDRWERAAEQVPSGEYEDDESLLTYPGAFWRSLEGYDPVERAESVDVPQFYLQGGRDYQVTVEGDFDQWRSAFDDVEDVSLTAYDELNHAFLPGEGPSVPEAYLVPNEVAEAVVEDVVSWITG